MELMHLVLSSLAGLWEHMFLWSTMLENSH